MYLLVARTVGSQLTCPFCYLFPFARQKNITFEFKLTRYSSFVNWELWWPQFPILVYFKETQTKPDGQVHFFPVIFVSSYDKPDQIFFLIFDVVPYTVGLKFSLQNGKQLYDVMVERAGPSKTSGPKQACVVEFL